METRANFVWVGAATLVLLVLVACFTVWIAKLGQGSRDDYDIYFRQSVDGLTRGAEVSYAGVAAGQVTQIEVWPQDPSVVRVRIAVNQKIPILQGTTATIQGSFTGLSTIQLSGGRNGAPPITAPGPDGEPVIPPMRSGLGALLTSAPILMDHLTTLTARLNDVFSPQNQRAISGILANTNQFTGNLAKASPQLGKTLAALKPEFEQQKEELLAASSRIYASALSEAELKEIAAFFKSATGVRYVNTQIPVIDKLYGEMQGWSRRTSELIMSRTRTELKKKNIEM